MLCHSFLRKVKGINIDVNRINIRVKEIFDEALAAGVALQHNTRPLQALADAVVAQAVPSQR
jgi:hypothetical protein